MRNVTFLLFFLSSSLRAQPITVMTYNIRYDNAGDGVNQWDKRRDRVFALLKKYDPDIIGVQEALHHQLTDITGHMGKYHFFGAGRDDGGKKGEYSAILIRKDRFELLDQNTFWLSKTPEVPGSKDWDAAITRVATWAKLRDKITKKVFVIINTHFDHIGKESRKNAAALLKQRAATLAKDLPLIITGDFNFTREAPPYRVIMDPSTLEIVDPAPANSPPGTACGFELNSRPCVAIDYIFHTTHWHGGKYQVVQDNDGKYYPSDHLPVVVELSLQHG